MTDATFNNKEKLTKNMKKRYLVGLGLIVVLLVGMNFLIFSNKSNDLEIGVIGTLTGIGSFFGQQEVRGLEIAKEIINSEGGVNGRNIELIVEDSQTKNELTVSAFNKLSNLDGVKFIVGDSWNSNSGALVPLLEDKVLAISPTAALSSLTKDDLFFRTVPSIKDMSYYLANYAYDNNIETVGIVSCTFSFCTEHADYFTEEFERLGGDVVETQIIQLGQEDVKTELTKIQKKNPQAVFIPISSTGMVNPLKQIKEFGMDVTILGGFGTESGALTKDYADISEGIIYPYFYDLEISTLEGTKFKEAYSKKYGSYPDSVAVNAYDALRVIADAIEKVGEDPVKVKEYILTQSYDLAGGKISFDQNGDAEKIIFMKATKSGKFVRIN